MASATETQATDEILLVRRVYKDGGDYTIKCPHCKRWIGLAEDDLSEIRGEQYQHRPCSGWLEVHHDARYCGKVPEDD